MKISSQKKEIFAHLKSGKTLTPLEALRLFGCLRLGARIFELRDKRYCKNYAITTKMVVVCRGKRVAQYSMKAKK